MLRVRLTICLQSGSSEGEDGPVVQKRISRPAEARPIVAGVRPWANLWLVYHPFSATPRGLCSLFASLLPRREAYGGRERRKFLSPQAERAVSRCLLFGNIRRFFFTFSRFDTLSS